MDEGVRYKDKITIVTGGSSGIGRGCVEVFGEFDILVYPRQETHSVLCLPLNDLSFIMGAANQTFRLNKFAC